VLVTTGAERGFKIRQTAKGAGIWCKRCGEQVGDYTPSEIVEHAFTGHQYVCPRCGQVASGKDQQGDVRG
jgi:DNA-directed RNA polymerase subunit RPC12/RpoP